MSSSEPGPELLSIRSFEARDEPAVITLWREVFGYTEPRNDPPAVIRQKLTHPDDLFLVATQGSGVVGTVMGGYDGHRGWMYALAVTPDRRAQGVGSDLVRELERRLTGLGCSKLNLQIHDGNADVVRFYESLGFRSEARISMGKLLSPEP